MKITGIEKAGGDRYTVYVDGEYWWILDLEIILQNSLKPGKEVDEQELENLRYQAQRRTARERAYYLLGYRDHSKKELYDKLCKNADPAVALEICELMESQNLLDDEEYAGKLARYYLQSKKWGGRTTLYEILRRGVDRETAEAAVEACGLDYPTQILELIQQKYSAYLEPGDYKGKQKVIAALSRKGYEYGDIKQAIAAYQSEDYEDDWE